MLEHELTAPETGADDSPTEVARRRRALAVVVAVSLLALALAAFVAWLDSGPDRPPGAWTLLPHQGLGAWVDVYDWTETFTDGTPPVGLDEIDAMAEAGVQTLYLQTGHARADVDVIEPDRSRDLIDRAHEHGMHVVAWYLPNLVDLDEDLRRLIASAELPVDGLGVDIESVEVPDPTERTRRLLELTDRLRTEAGPEVTLAAITLTPVHLEVVNRDYWPGYPWVELARSYDVILPMAYWSIRTGELRSGPRYIGENIDRLRALTGDADIPIHPIGGIADDVAGPDLEGMVTAIEGRGAIGGSLYDWATSTAEQWSLLAPLRDLRPGGGR